jgi:uncharacterized Fe-S center protein
MTNLLAKVAELRRVMELFDLFQQDDEVGVALKDVEYAILESVFHSILQYVQEKYYDSGLESQMEEAHRLFTEGGFGDFKEI